MDTTNTTYLNKNFRFVYSPKLEINPNDLFSYSLYKIYNYKRFLLGAGQLSKYLTKKNAETVILATQKMKTDKKTIKFRKYGIIEIYVK